MATTLNRASTWTNSDGLVVGFGPNRPAKEGSDTNSVGGIGTRSVTFTWDDMASASVNVPMNAGERVIGVQLRVDETFLGGTSLQVGYTGGDVDAFLTATEGAVANLIAGAVIDGEGVDTYDDTADGDVTAHTLHRMTAADTLDVLATGTFTAGKATLVVTYIR